MTVEASNYMNLMPSHQVLHNNRETMKPNHHHQQQQYLLNSTLYNNAQVDSTAMVQQGKMAQTFMPFYQSNVCDPNKADSGLTCHNIPLQRKRSRDFTTELTTSLPPHQKIKLSPQSSLLDQDILFQIQKQHQSEIDHVLAHHAEKVRMELVEQKMRQSRMLLGTIQEITSKKLREKDEEIQRIEKVNIALQEKVKSLCIENQIWRELAQTNETTANYLRSNLEQVLAHVGTDHRVVEAVADDAESSCGSNGAAENGEDTAASVAVGGGRNMCKNCGVRESIVLLLPCKHLCLCTICGSTVHNCPVCNSGMNASVHVNLS